MVALDSFLPRLDRRARPGFGSFVPLLLLFSTAVAATSGGSARPIARLLASSVCIVGDLPPGERFGASGFVVAPGDRILTTAHAIGRAVNLRVKTSDGRMFPARVERLGDERADLALLALLGGRLDPATLGSLADLSPGDEVLTVGCPLGFEFSVTSGVVSSLRPSSLGYPLIQTDVPVNPGSSGGPLFDKTGRVVGIVKGRVEGRERIHFALPIDLGRALLESVDRERLALESFNQGVLAARLEEKVALYRSALKADPQLVEAHYNLALALEHMGRGDEAASEYRQVLQRQPGHPAATLNLGALLYDRGRYAEAIDAYRATLALNPRAVAIRQNLAETYRALGDATTARREFEAIVKDAPDYAPAHYGLGVLYDEAFHDSERAADHYRRYLALAPQAGDAGKVRTWLEKLEGHRGTP